MSGNWAISTYVDEIYGPRRMDEALALVQRSGVKYVDPRIVDEKHSFMEVGNDELRRFKEKLDYHGLKVAALGSPIFKTSLKGTQPKVFGSRHGFDLDASKRFEDHLKLLSRAFEIAEMFQADNIRIFAFWREHKLDDVFDEVVDKLGRAVRLAEKAGHTLSLENEMKTMAGTGAELARILKAINSPRLSGTYDVGNAGRLNATVYPDDYEPLKGRLGHLHLKFERVDVTCGWPSGGYESYDGASTAWRERLDVPHRREQLDRHEGQQQHDARDDRERDAPAEQVAERRADGDAEDERGGAAARDDGDRSTDLVSRHQVARVRPHHRPEQSVGEPPTRGATGMLESYSTMPWVRAVAGRVAGSMAAVEGRGV